MRACPSISTRRTQSHRPLLVHVISFRIQFSLFRSSTLCDTEAAHGFSCNMQYCLYWPSLAYSYYFINRCWWRALSRIKLHSLFWLWILCVCVRARARARAVCSATWLSDLRKMAMRVIIFRKATWNKYQKQLNCLQVRRKVNRYSYMLMSVNITSLIVFDTAIANMGQWDVFENETDSDIPFPSINATELRWNSHYLFYKAAWYIHTCHV